MKVTLIAPTLNEIEAVRAVLPKIKKEWVDELIVVDGGSTDGTVEFCRANGYRVHRQSGKGYGNAMQEGYELATGDFVIEFPADGNSLPEKISDVVNKLNEGYDFVIASRYKPPAVNYDDDFLTSKGNWMFTKMVNLLFWSSYSDVLVGFRGYRRSVFKDLNMDAKGLSWSIQMPIKFIKRGLRVAEIAADEPERIGGVRKMSPFKTGWEILMLMLKERFTKK
ncbi:MAG: histidinol-phosphate phosphatase family protein [Parcubacteria group bacterium Gr01-1014_3]|nr:MAG: histidinol-phosphate phosphatase family protein [Parcubacteria group bacterium Gr01-1014_3]